MRKIIIPGMVGNALEWYDFILYAQFSHIISKEFFPNSSLSTIYTFGVFAVGFISRPLGAIFFGRIGDRFGRRLSLMISVFTMAVPTTIIGLLPSYERIGMAAPITLVIMRLLQGFSLGGEFSGCVAYFVEHSPKAIRGLVGSTVYVSQCFGMLLGLAVASVFTLSLSEESLLTWGWRIPFISGMLIGMVGLYIRIRLAESPLYLEAKISGYLSSCPLREALWDWRKILLGIGLYINVTAQFYAATVFIPSYMTTVGYLPHQSSIACSIILITMMIFFPIAANISDKIGRKPVMIASCIGIVMTVCPVFFAINSMNYQTAIFSEIIFAIIVAIHMGPVPTILSELFPTRVRFTSVAFSSNVSAAIFGGTVPMIGAALYQFTGKFSVAYYLTSLAVFGFFIILRYRETLGQVLSDIKKETACPDLKIETGRREEKRILEPS